MRRSALGHVQREHSFIAWAGSAVAGASLNDIGPDTAARRVANQGWIQDLCVRRAWRGRGLRRALLGASVASTEQIGYASAGLNVDVENPTGAAPLYQAAGFQPVARRFMYQRSNTPGLDEELNHQDEGGRRQDED
jgi:mycothiol synthase